MLSYILVVQFRSESECLPLLILSVVFLTHTVRGVVSECPNYNMIIPLLLTEKLEDLPNKCKLTPGKC